MRRASTAPIPWTYTCSSRARSCSNSRTARRSRSAQATPWSSTATSTDGTTEESRRPGPSSPSAAHHAPTDRRSDMEPTVVDIAPAARTAPLRCGVFLPPYHNPRRNPTMAIEQDLRHVEDLDRLGFHQVWFGEHHSGGYEVGPSPELMIAAA